MKPLELLPAIDIKNGKVIQLSSAVSGSSTVMVEPLEVIQRFSSAGSKWIHLVDLDAAYGTGENQVNSALSADESSKYSIIRWHS